MDENTVLIAGPPRSGTTLTCELLNHLPDVRALDEPLTPRFLLGDEGSDPPDADAIGQRLAQFATEQRTSLLTAGTARTKHVGGQVLGAKVSDEFGDDGLRVRHRELGPAPLGTPRVPFTLAIKQPVAFTALLPALARNWRMVAIVRNPLATLCSWESVPMKVRDGRMGMPAWFMAGFKQRLDAIPDRLDRQVELLSWMYERIVTTLSEANVIRYEDVIATGGRALAPIAESATMLDRPLTDRNRMRFVPAGYAADVGQRLLDRDAGWWRYYDRTEVEALIRLTDSGDVLA